MYCCEADYYTAEWIDYLCELGARSIKAFSNYWYYKLIFMNQATHFLFTFNIVNLENEWDTAMPHKAYNWIFNLSS